MSANVNEFDRFETLIEENKIQDALSCAENIRGYPSKTNLSLEEMREKVRSRAREQENPRIAFKLLNVLQKWRLNPPHWNYLQESHTIDLELNILENLIRGGHFNEFWELLSQIRLMVIPQNFNYKIIEPFNMLPRKLHNLRKENCKKFLEKSSEMLELLRSEEDRRRRMEAEISIFQNFAEDLKKQEEFMQSCVNDVLSGSLQELNARLTAAEERYTKQEVALEQLREENRELRIKVEESRAGLQGQSESLRANTQAIQEINQGLQKFENEIAPLRDSIQILRNQVQGNELQYQNLKEQFHQLSSSMNGMDERLQEQFDGFKRSFESLISIEAGRQTFRIQNQIYGLQDLCNTLTKHVLENLKQSNRCEEEHKKAMEEIRQITTAMKTQNKIEDQKLKEAGAEREFVVSSHKNMEELLQVFHSQQKMMEQLLKNIQQNSNTHESQDPLQALSIKQPGEEEKIQVRKPKEKDTDEGRRLDFNQQKGERKEQTSEIAFHQNDRADVSSMQVTNNTWEVVRSHQD